MRNVNERREHYCHHCNIKRFKGVYYFVCDACYSKIEKSITIVKRVLKYDGWDKYQWCRDEWEQIEKLLGGDDEHE